VHRLWNTSNANLLSARQFVLTATLALITVAAPTFAAESIVDAFTVKLRDNAVVSNVVPLPAAVRSELSRALQMPFVEAGGTRDGAVQLRLATQVPLDQARAAVSRVRLLPDVLYASIGEANSAARGAPVAKSDSQAPAVRRIIVKYYDPGLSQAARDNQPLGPTQLNELSIAVGQPVASEKATFNGAYVVRLFQAVPVDKAVRYAQLLAANTTIDYVEPDLLKHPMLTPNDTYYPLQWHYQSPPTEMGGVNLPPAWDRTVGSSSIVVGVIDTGILPHPDLAGRYLAGYDMIADPLVANDQQPASCTTPGSCSSRDSDPSDPGDWVTSAESMSGYFQGCTPENSSFHGTHVSGTIGAATNNGTGVAGINWISKLLPVRVLGKCGGYTSDIADAIVWASGGSVPGVPANPNPARVLNLSLGGDGACDVTTQNAINAALAARAVVVVAAGNSNADAATSSPANCNGVITVAATGRQGQRASYSNFGTTVEISAPGGSDGQGAGVGVLSTLNDGTTSPDPQGYDYVYYQGTSMATPHVTGIASLMLSVNPSLTPAQVLAKITTTARAFPTGTVRDCTTSLCGAGIIDAGAAVQAAIGITTTTSTTLASSVNPATLGATVTFTATVMGSHPTGNVTFTDNGSAISVCVAVPLVSAGNSATAACSTAGLSAGTHSIAANYGGDPGNSASNSSPLSQVIAGGGSGGLANGGFETPALAAGGYQYTPSGGSWTFSGGSGIQSNGSAWGAPAAPDGQQTAFLQGFNAQIAQTVNLAAGSYSVSFYAARRAYQGAVQPIQITIDGIAVGSPISPVDTNFALFTSAVFTVAAGNHTVQLTSTNGNGDNSSFVDAVTLNPGVRTSALADGNFETPALAAGGYQYTPSGGSWTFGGGSGIQSNGSAWGAPAAPDGQQTAFLQGSNAQIAQTVNLAAGSYSVSFYAARRAYQGAVQPIQISIDGIAVGSPISPVDTNFARFTSAVFTVGAGNHTLQLTSTNGDGDNSSFVDAVTLNAQ
jgi:serine protease